MGTLYLVRHGQASFGADDYDRLSELGQRQSVRLGESFAERGVHFDALIAGTLTRHRQTLAGILQGMDRAGEAVEWEGLNEYDAGAVIASVHPEKLQRPDTPELYRHHFRLLRDGLAQWIAGSRQPAGMPTYAQFSAGVAAALDEVRANHYGRTVLVVSSGGPIATAVGHVLGARPEAMIDLNLRIRNTAVTEFAFTPKRHMLSVFNALPHLDAPAFREWVTFA